MDRTRRANRLVESTSPYLLQHAYNPVEWYPWGTEAIEKARREEKPIFLSIGYSACHWCHVMEREVFEKEEIAAIMNTHFVNIKVDREERPDLDELYMMATQVMSGSGGWPMSVWLTPNLEPFYAGTYFPPEDGYGRPGFPRLELALADAWKNKRTEILEQARRVVEAIKTHADETQNTKRETPKDIDLGAWISLAVQQFADKFDAVNGGLGTAPKFPPHQALLFWVTMLKELESKSTGNAGEGLESVREMLGKTLDGMMRGGIYDHVGGGFARYSTDEKWLVPHFEKMLYDNAQLAPVYAEASVLLGRADYARVARETLNFWLRDMTGKSGEFYSTLDADSQGEEGKFYVWTLEELRASVPDEGERQLLVDYFGLTERGNWHESPVAGGSVLAIAKPRKDRSRIESLLVDLRKVRAGREWPGLDDKVLTGWNGLMISAMAVCGRLLGEPKYVAAAKQAWFFLMDKHLVKGRLMRVSRGGGMGHTDAFLEDYAHLLNGAIDLHQATSDVELLKSAEWLASTMIAEFEDKAHGGFYFTGTQHETLFAQMKNAADNATPSPNGMAIRGLLRLGRDSGKTEYRDAAIRAVDAFAQNIGRRPEYFPTILTGLLNEVEVESGKEEGPLVESTVLRLEPVAAIQAATGEAFEIPLVLRIADGYHIQPAVEVSDGMHATAARVRGDVAIATQEWKYPDTASVTTSGRGYQGRVEIIGRCLLAKEVTTGRYKLRATVLAQACSGTHCLEPETVSIDIALVVTS